MSTNWRTGLALISLVGVLAALGWGMPYLIPAAPEPVTCQQLGLEPAAPGACKVDLSVFTRIRATETTADH